MYFVEGNPVVPEIYFVMSLNFSHWHFHFGEWLSQITYQRDAFRLPADDLYLKGVMQRRFSLSVWWPPFLYTLLKQIKAVTLISSMRSIIADSFSHDGAMIRFCPVFHTSCTVSQHFTALAFFSGICSVQYRNSSTVHYNKDAFRLEMLSKNV